MYVCMYVQVATSRGSRNETTNFSATAKRVEAPVITHRWCRSTPHAAAQRSSLAPCVYAHCFFSAKMVTAAEEAPTPLFECCAMCDSQQRRAHEFP